MRQLLSKGLQGLQVRTGARTESLGLPCVFAKPFPLLSPPLQLVGNADTTSPLLVLQQIGGASGSDKLQQLVQRCLQEGVMLTVTAKSVLDKFPGPPSVRLYVTSQHGRADLERAASVIITASRVVFSP